LKCQSKEAVVRLRFQVKIFWSGHGVSNIVRTSVKTPEQRKQKLPLQTAGMALP
jgi:hypothetical protein